MKYVFGFGFIEDLSNKLGTSFYNMIKDYPDIMKAFIWILGFIKKVITRTELKDKDCTDEKFIETLIYGFEGLIGAIIKGLLFVGIGYIFGVFKPLIFVLASFGILRVFAGGFHMESYTKCIYFSLLVILAGAFIGKYVEYNIIINSVAFLFTLVTFLLYTPVENESRPIKPNEIKKFRVISLINLLLLFILNTIIIQQIAISVGITISGIIVLPIFNKKTRVIETYSV